MDVERRAQTMKISSKGQVVIPAAIRNTYGWSAGTEVVVKEARPSIITFKKRKTSAQGIGTKYKGALKGIVPSTKEYLASKKEDIKLEE